MAYSRWGSDSDWYVFWHGAKADSDAAAAGRPKPKSEERLAIWRAKREERSLFTYLEVREMLASGDLSRIRGFDEPSRSLLVECMSAFIEDVDRDEPL